MLVTIGFGQIDEERPKRPGKGKSKLQFPTSYVVLDLETTGLEPMWDSIIEFAGIRYVDNQPVAEFTSLINPGEELDEYITELTGITNDMLVDAPMLEDVLPQIREFIGDDIIVAHNANFDINFLYDAYQRVFGVPLSNGFVDTLRLSRNLYPEYKHHRLRDLVTRFGVGETVAHRALSDVQQTQACYDRMRADFGSGAVTWTRGIELRAKDITAETTDFDIDSPIYGKKFCFTGALKYGKRSDAMQAVVNRGGTCSDTLRQDVDYLVIGDEGYSMQLRDGKSSKWRKALEMKLKGSPIEVLAESTFVDMLNA